SSVSVSAVCGAIGSWSVCVQSSGRRCRLRFQSSAALRAMPAIHARAELALGSKVGSERWTSAHTSCATSSHSDAATPKRNNRDSTRSACSAYRSSKVAGSAGGLLSLTFPYVPQIEKWIGRRPKNRRALLHGGSGGVGALQQSVVGAVPVTS